MNLKNAKWILVLLLLCLPLACGKTGENAADLTTTPVLMQSAAAAPHSPGKVVHEVTGSSVAEEEGIAFRSSVAAHQDDQGNVWGEVVVNLDLRNIDLGIITLVNRVTCLDVDGNSAWIGGHVIQSTNEDIVPSGTDTITLVRDLGGNGEDIMHGEPFPPDVLCTSRPALTETVVTYGNYTVR